MLAEFPGSPLLALNAVHRGRHGRNTRFGHFHFCNQDARDFEVLNQRIERFVTTPGCPIRREQIVHTPGDSNELIGDILASIPPKTTSSR